MIKAWYTDAPTVALVLAAVGNLYTALTGVFPMPKIEVTPLIALIMGALTAFGVFGTSNRPANMKIGLKTRKRGIE